MRTNSERRTFLSSFLRTFVLPALTLLLIPAIALGFARYAQRDTDAQVLKQLRLSIEKDTTASEGRRADLVAFFEKNSASNICRGADARLAEFRKDVCPDGSALSQFLGAELVAKVALGIGVVALLGALLLGGIAHSVPRFQYAALMCGWGALVAVSFFEILAQGGLVVWLSYWVTAVFFHVYMVKLIFLAALGAGAAAWIALLALFPSIPAEAFVEGTVLSEADAPSLFSRIHELASKVGTMPPSAVIAGIDDNFFVTEAPIRAGECLVEGRSLFLSLPLLRVLSPTEADAVLAHELAHFRGRDTELSARLGPAVARYDAYVFAISGSALALPAVLLMTMFRALFELARRSDGRRREERADRLASEFTSKDDVARALLKISSYSSCRASAEREIFASSQVFSGPLGLRDRIAAGLAQHATSTGFLCDLDAATVPHPFDTHPSIADRLALLGSTLGADDCARLVAETPERTWADDIAGAQGIEAGLWAAFELRFSQAHERRLAYIYLPETDDERAHVERFFPPLTFQTKEGTVRISCDRIDLADGRSIAFRLVEDLSISQEYVSKTLVLKVSSGAWVAIKLKPFGDAGREFTEAAGHYWSRARSAATEASTRIRPRA